VYFLALFAVKNYFCPMFKHIGTYLQKELSLDVRALSWMRICLGLVLIADWIIRMQSTVAHYTNAGVLPQQILIDYQWKEGFYSLFMWSDSLAWQYFLFFAAIVFSFFFTIGYFTRLSNLVVWVLLCSVHARNPFILQAGDELLRMALFWGIFLPLGKMYSVDAFHKKDLQEDQAGKTVFNIQSMGLMILVFGVYFFSALQKTSPEWRSAGTAIYYALSLDQMALPLGKVLLNYPGLCKALTHVVFYTELIAPLLFFIPYKNKLFRAIGIALLVILQIGIASTLFVGLFFCIGISTLIALLPSSAIDWISSRAPRFTKHIPVAAWFSRVLPSFAGIRKAIGKGLQKIDNFYTKTILQFALLFILCICTIWNLGNLHTGLTVTGPFRTLTYFLRIDQNWGMFSPGVFKDDGWFVLEGETDDNKQKIDLYRNGQPVSYDKPDYVLKYIPDDRWRKFGENYIMIDYEYIRPAYCRYMIDKWNREHKDNPVHSLQVFYMKETTPPPGEKAKVTREVLCTCKNN
jgi:hypothetical protein